MKFIEIETTVEGGTVLAVIAEAVAAMSTEGIDPTKVSEIEVRKEMSGGLYHLRLRGSK